MDPETLIVALRKSTVLVVMYAVSGTIIGAVSGLLTPAQYISTTNASLGVEGSEANSPSTFDCLASITSIPVEIGTSKGTFAGVSKSTGTSQDELRKSVSVINKTSTALVEIRAISTDPEHIHRITEVELTVLDSAARDLSSLGQAGNVAVTLKVVNSPTTPSALSSPLIMSTTLIGTAAGLAVGTVMTILLYFLGRRNPQGKVKGPLFIIGRRRSREGT